MSKGGVERLAWLVAAVLQVAAALVLGLMAFNIDVLGMLPAGAAMVVKPLQLLFGLAGLAGLYGVVSGCCCSGKC